MRNRVRLYDRAKELMAAYKCIVGKRRVVFGGLRRTRRDCRLIRSLLKKCKKKKKAGVERGLYTKEQRTIQAFCRIIKSCDNSDQLGRDH